MPSPNEPTLLTDLYEKHYLQGTVISEKKEHEKEEEDEDEVAEESEKKTKKLKKGKAKAKGKKKDSDDAGVIGYDSTSFDNIFARLLQESDDFGSGEGDEEDDFSFHDEGDLSDTDDAFGAESMNDEEGEVSVSRSKIREIIDLLEGLLGEGEGGDEFGDEDDSEGFEYGSDVGDDQLPSESVDSSNYLGDQGDYSGKAKRQGQTTHVKGDGSAKVGQSQNTGYQPQESEDGEVELGDQGDYSGKAKRQAPSTHVKGDGSAKVGQSNDTGYRTSKKTSKQRF